MKTTLGYGFTFGRSPLLSLAELESVFTREGLKPAFIAAGRTGAVIRDITLPNPQAFLDGLGGTIRIVELVTHIGLKHPHHFHNPLTEQVQSDLLVRDYLPPTEKNKITFGFSVFFLSPTPPWLVQDTVRFLRQRARKVKEDFKSRRRPSRFIQTTNEAADLSSVQVRHQGLLAAGGVELCLFVNGTDVYMGRTVAVQDFARYSARDYDRPHREAKVGMLPPKVAQVMLNLARVPRGKTILDPFAGIGTILQEGLLMGYPVVGSDISPDLIAKTQENLTWLTKQAPAAGTPLPAFRLFPADVRTLAEQLPPASIDGVVTETYLGPPRTTLPSSPTLKRLFTELGDLQKAAFTALGRVVKPGTRLVVALPFYRDPTGATKTESRVPFLDSLLPLGYRIQEPLSAALQKQSGLPVSLRHTLSYVRPQQVVGREIVIFERT